MGDAQYGMHDATALGWMTFEGTKSFGTDLHSKTAKILSLTRDQAQVFNYFWGCNGEGIDCSGYELQRNLLDGYRYY